METVQLSDDGAVTIHQVHEGEGIGYELTFEVKAGSPLDAELEQHFRSGELLPFSYQEEELPVSIRTMADMPGERRRYEGTAGFLRPGMGGAGG